MTKIENDAYFTPDNIALACIEDFYKEIPEYKNLQVVEPSAGGGAFLRAFKEINVNYEAYDLYPQTDEIIQADYLKTELDLTEKVILGNPPYGKSNKLVIDFIKKSFQQGAEAVGFLLFGSVLNYYHLKRINHEIVYYKRLNNFSFVNSNGYPVLNTKGKHEPIFVVFGKNELQKIKENYVEYGTQDIWTWFGNYGGFNERNNASAKPYKRDEYTISPQSKNKMFVSSDPTRVSYIFNVIKDFNKKMYEDLMWMYISGKIPPDTINFHASYPEINKGWISVEKEANQLSDIK